MFKDLDERAAKEAQDERAKLWEKEELLQKCTEERADLPAYIFYEGPPTANGKPGIHHVLARTLKDSVNRYWSMKGYYVPRKAGWDTHGLPVEIEVEKELGFSGKGDIERYGIAEFNEKCRASVFKYEGLWREMTRRMGFLVDTEHPYITLDNDYIETVWWLLKKFFDEGYIYEGHKILPYCPRCGTGLASHEVSLGYKEVSTNTVTVLFKRKDADEYFLAWTTTPWTLAANVALTVGAEIVYIKAEISEGEQAGKVVWLARALADKVLGEGNYKVLEEKKGQELEGLEYEQLMPFVDAYAGTKPGTKAFFVTLADYVGEEDGTGIVHTAPAFGEDDYKTGRRYGLPVVNPVGEDGHYKETPWAGTLVTDEGLAVEIIKWLASEGKLFAKAKFAHNYPHCWRCGSPLIYYSKPSWYIEMTKLKGELVSNNNSVNWKPDFVGEKRFGNWLENVNDWAISRTRYWGTPIPVWRCEECGELHAIGSRAELAERAIGGLQADAAGKIDVELHRPYVDEIHIKCEKCGGEMTRIPEVLDCWFDSGSMPYAQRHYPFEHKDDFYEKYYPADFICEGIDQTRGWFYSLLAISTFVEKDRVRAEGERAFSDKGRGCYRNCLVNDLVLDKDGQKMSKTRGNTVDPFEIFDKYGADAARWYLLSTSPAWTPTRFDEAGLSETAAGFFGTLKNVYKFFVLYANQDELDPREWGAATDETLAEADRWVLSRLANLVTGVRAAMDDYDHMKATRAIQDFVIEDLSNWYIRRSRRRFWASETTPDKKAVYAVTYEILLTVSKLMAPFAPFLADEIYLNLAGADVKSSVHLEDFPIARESDKDAALEEKMELVRQLVSLGRAVREKERLKVRQPLAAALVDVKYEPLIGKMTDLIREELNIKEVRFEKNTGAFMNYALKPNFKAAGPALGGKIKAFSAALAGLSGDKALDFLSQVEKGEGTLELDGESISVPAELVETQISAKEGFAVGMEAGLFIILDTALTDALIREGLAREFVSKVQQMRKSAGLEMMDRIEIYYAELGGGSEIRETVAEYKDYISKETLANAAIEKSETELADATDTELNGRAVKIKLIAL